MLGLRLAPRLFVISLATITLILMSASMMAAQTPTASVEKAVVESNATAPESASTNSTAPSAASSTVAKEETEKISGSNSQTDTEPVKESSCGAGAAPQVIAPCPPGTRMIKADVVAIPQALMLNRLGATIPNGFVFALRADTIKTGLGNIQLRPGKRPRPSCCVQTSGIASGSFSRTQSRRRISDRKLQRHSLLQSQRLKSRCTFRDRSGRSARPTMDRLSARTRRV